MSYKKFLIISNEHGHVDTYFVNEDLLDYTPALEITEYQAESVSLADLLRLVIKADRDDSDIEVREGPGFVPLMPPAYAPAEVPAGNGATTEALARQGKADDAEPDDDEPGAPPYNGEFRRRVRGELLDRLWYSPKGHTLYARFKASGDVYAYFAVPEQVWRDFRRRLDEGGSAGSYFNNYVKKPGYANTKIDEAIAERMAREAEGS